jgi:hypothetical protein
MISEHTDTVPMSGEELDACKAMLRSCIVVTLYPVPARERPQGQRSVLRWVDVVARVSSPIEAPSKEALPGWSPARFADDYRDEDNVERVFALGFDVDEAPSTKLSELRELLAPYAAIVHSTYSHTADAPRWRVWVRASRPMTGAEYELVWLRFRSTVLAGIGVGSAAKDPSRFWYQPGHAPGAPYEHAMTGGAPVDVDALLSESEAPKPIEGLPVGSPAPRAEPVRPDVVTRARAWLQTAEPAISGKGGSKVAFRVVERVVRGFALSDGEALDALSPWNSRCEPSWDTSPDARPEDSLLRLIRRGRELGDTPIGSLRDEAPKVAPREAPAAESVELVHIVTAEEFFTADEALDLVVPELGITFGPATGLVGEAYCGKTLAVSAAGLAVASGRKVWGRFACKRGVWLHLDHEQGLRQTKIKLRRMAYAMGIADDELRELLSAAQIRLAIYPSLNLTTKNARDHYKRLFDGVTLVTADSLRLLLGETDENSSQVRPLMQHMTYASEATGAACIHIHHAGLPPPKDSTRSRKHMGRGSSSITDEWQSKFVMTKAKGDEVALVSHEKDRALGEEVPDFGIRIADVTGENGHPKWGLDVSYVECGPPPPVEKRQETFAELQARIIECCRTNEVAGIDGVLGLLGGAATKVRAATKDLIAKGELVSVPTGQGRGNRLRPAPPTESHYSDVGPE